MLEQLTRAMRLAARDAAARNHEAEAKRHRELNDRHGSLAMTMAELSRQLLHSSDEKQLIATWRLLARARDDWSAVDKALRDLQAADEAARQRGVGLDYSARL